jgi:hypothetical protein
MCREWMGKPLCSISLRMPSVLSLPCRSFEVFGAKILNVKLRDWEVGDRESRMWARAADD